MSERDKAIEEAKKFVFGWEGDDRTRESIFDNMADFTLSQTQEIRNENSSLLKLLTDIRFALGDNGKRMQDELVEYCKEIREKAEAEKELKLLVSFINSSEMIPLGFYEAFLAFKQKQAEGGEE